MPKSHHYMVMGTGTDIGKTYVTSLLLQDARRRGIEARAVKPIMSGVESVAANDAATLLRAMGTPITADTVKQISPWQFQAPLSPHRAAALEGKTINIDDVYAWCKVWCEQHHNGLIEAVGGIMVPLTYHTTTLDWAKQLGLPVILVTGTYLGTLSHTLTSLQCLHQANISLAGIIVNHSSVSVEPQDAITTLRALSPYDCPIVSLPRNDVANSETLYHLPAYSDFFAFSRTLMI